MSVDPTTGPGRASPASDDLDEEGSAVDDASFHHRVAQGTDASQADVQQEEDSSATDVTDSLEIKADPEPHTTDPTPQASDPPANTTDPPANTTDPSAQTSDEHQQLVSSLPADTVEQIPPQPLDDTAQPEGTTIENDVRQTLTADVRRQTWGQTSLDSDQGSDDTERQTHMSSLDNEDYRGDAEEKAQTSSEVEEDIPADAEAPVVEEDIPADAEAPVSALHWAASRPDVRSPTPPVVEEDVDSDLQNQMDSDLQNQVASDLQKQVDSDLQNQVDSDLQNQVFISSQMEIKDDTGSRSSSPSDQRMLDQEDPQVLHENVIEAQQKSPPDSPKKVPDPSLLADQTGEHADSQEKDSDLKHTESDDDNDQRTRTPSDGHISDDSIDSFKAEGISLKVEAAARIKVTSDEPPRVAPATKHGHIRLISPELLEAERPIIVAASPPLSTSMPLRRMKSPDTRISAGHGGQDTANKAEVEKHFDACGQQQPENKPLEGFREEGLEEEIENPEATLDERIDVRNVEEDEEDTGRKEKLAGGIDLDKDTDDVKSETSEVTSHSIDHLKDKSQDEKETNQIPPYTGEDFHQLSAAETYSEKDMYEPLYSHEVQSPLHKGATRATRKVRIEPPYYENIEEVPENGGDSSHNDRNVSTVSRRFRMENVDDIQAVTDIVEDVYGDSYDMLPESSVVDSDQRHLYGSADDDENISSVSEHCGEDEEETYQKQPTYQMLGPYSYQHPSYSANSFDKYEHLTRRSFGETDELLSGYHDDTGSVISDVCTPRPDSSRVTSLSQFKSKMPKFSSVVYSFKRHHAAAVRTPPPTPRPSVAEVDVGSYSYLQADPTTHDINSYRQDEKMKKIDVDNHGYPQDDTNKKINGRYSYGHTTKVDLSNSYEQEDTRNVDSYTYEQDEKAKEIGPSYYSNDNDDTANKVDVSSYSHSRATDPGSYSHSRATDAGSYSHNQGDTTKKKLEDSILRDTEEFTLRGTDGSSAKIPARIREIITKNLSSDEFSGPLPEMSSHLSVGTLQEENRLLSQELNRVEDLLSASRAERDELSIKYNALSERLEHSLRSDSGLDTSSDMTSRSLVQQNIDLRRKLEEEQSGYKRKLQAYQEGQQRQAQLVQKLQAKLLQYKKKCQDLEQSLHTKNIEINHVYNSKTSTENRYKFAESESANDLDSALVQLEEERQRCNGLEHVNTMLREQLDQATSTNQQLTIDIHKLTQDWQQAREELEAKEMEWRSEEKSFNEYFNSEHSRLLSLWRAVVAFRRQFSEMKIATERDLAGVKGEVQKASRTMHSACLNLNAHMRSDDTHLQVSLDKERSERLAMESTLRDKAREIHDLQDKMNDLTMKNERLKIQLEEKEKALVIIQRSVSHVDKPVELPETDTARQVREETEALHSALRNIAEAVINDADQSAEDEEPGVSRRCMSPAFRASSVSPTRSRSPYGRIRSPHRSPSPRARSRSPAFADATFSAVQAALNKRQLQVSDLRAKLQVSREHGVSLKKTVEDVVNEKKRMEIIIMNLKEDLETVRREKDDSSRDRDRIKNALNQTGSEKTQLERVRLELNTQIENLQKEAEKLKSINGDLQRQRDTLEDEKEDMSKDRERQLKENERCQRVIEQLELKMSTVREELVATKEALSRALLDKEVLDGQTRELGDSLSRSELQKAELEVEINKLKTDEATLKDALLKMQALNEALGQDKMELNRIIQQLELEKASLFGEKSALEQEKSGIREELVRVEQEKMDLDTEKHGLNHTLELSELSRQQVEEEIRQLTKDKQEIIAQLNMLSRQKHALAEELLNTRRELEKVQVVVERLIKDKEILTQDKAELIVQVTACERENRQQSELISAYVADKDSLESALFEAQQQIRELEVRKAQLEGENQELIVKKENLQSEVVRLEKEKVTDYERFEFSKNNLNQRLQQLERDSQLALTQEKQAHEEDVERLSHERDTQRAEFDSERERLVHQHNMEKEELNTSSERQKEELLQELAMLQRDRDDTLLMAENDKQQVIALLEQEKSVLQEKIVLLTSDLTNLNVEYERIRREAQVQQEQDRSKISNLQAEKQDIRAQVEEMTEAHEKEVKDLTAQIKELIRQREGLLREVAELKAQLKAVEEAKDAVRRDLIDANRTIREGDEIREQMRREIIETKRAVNEEIREKELVTKTAEDLRNKIKKLEADKTEMGRLIQEAKQRIGVLNEQKAGVQKEATELRNNLREVEKARLEARRELQELRRQVKMLDGERSKLGKEVVELQVRVARDEEKEEESRKTSFDLKQKVVETEASREALRKDLANLQRKMAELIDEARMKEKDYQLALEDSRRSERKLDDNRRNLEIALENSNAESAELRLKLSGAEGRVGALETALARLEGAKRDIEFKLNSIVSSLRRTIGFRMEMPRSKSPILSRSRSPSPRRSRPTSPTKGFDSTYATTTEGRGSPIPRTGSPLRSGSPYRSRSMSPGRIDCSDVDPEAVRMALRDFMAQLACAERERDDAISQVRSLTTQIKDIEDERERVDNRLTMLQKSLGDAEEGKRDIDGRLASAQTALMLQEETIRRNDRERKALTDKVNNLERSITAAESEKRQQQEKISKMKQSECKLDEDKKQLRISLDESENRCTKIELNRRALEGELQRMRMAMNDKETENQVLQDRTENLMKQIQDLEAKAQSLQLTIDRLTTNLAKTEDEGHKSKDKVQALNLSLSDSNALINDLEETVNKLSRNLAASEHDRGLLQERLEATRQALNDAKKQNHILMDRLQAIQGDMAATEVRCSELEGQIRQSNNLLEQRKESEQEVNQRLQKICADKQALQERVASLSRTLNSIETEKREIERSTMRLEKDKTALIKTLDKVEREKLQTEELAHKSIYNKDNVDRTLTRLEEDNITLQRQIQELQAQLAEAEQAHAQRLIDLTTRHRAETEMETERLRSAQQQAERLLEAREKAHRQKVKGLEEQNAFLKDQIAQELRKRQQYITKSTRAGEEMKDLRSVLDTSLSNIIHDPNLDPILLEQETRRLDESLSYSRSFTPRRRSPARTMSPGRVGFTSTPQYHSVPLSPILRRKLKQ